MMVDGRKKFHDVVSCVVEKKKGRKFIGNLWERQKTTRIKFDVQCDNIS